MSIILNRVNSFFDDVWEKKRAFFLTFFCICMLSYGVLYAIDFIPEKPAAVSDEPIEEISLTTTPESEEVENTEEQVGSIYPVRITIPELGTDIEVLNPTSSNIADLDAALLKGVVRHPGSADFKNKGTMLLFGHSSYLPVVKNQNFKAFNGLQNLEKRDEIRVFSEDTEYVYKVTKVYKAAASDASVDLVRDTETLVLVTCNSFGSKDDRFVVEAGLIEKNSL